jgi:hypothetical protein
MIPLRKYDFLIFSASDPSPTLPKGEVVNLPFLKGLLEVFENQQIINGWERY